MRDSQLNRWFHRNEMNENEFPKISHKILMWKNVHIFSNSIIKIEYMSIKNIVNRIGQAHSESSQM